MSLFHLSPRNPAHLLLLSFPRNPRSPVPKSPNRPLSETLTFSSVNPSTNTSVQLTMSSALDMSLEDLIKNNKKSGGGGGPRGRGRGGGTGGPGPARRFQSRGANRTTPYSMGKPVQAPDSTWQHDMYKESAGAAFPAPGGGRASAIETGTKLYISNLDYGVSNEDIKELFSEVGDLKRYSIHYDRSGRSKGTAEVVFSRRNDATAAVKRYNNVQLDGKPMNIEIVGTNMSTAAMPASSNGILGNPNVVPRSGPPRGRASSRLRGGGNAGGRGFDTGGGNGGGRGFDTGGGNGGGRGFGGRGRGRGRAGGRGEAVSAEALDADLEKYHSESMQIN